MTSIPPPMCYGCTHKREGLTCDAFPAGIPLEIVRSVADHREPFHGDNGIRFEPRDTAAADYADQLFPKTPA